MQVEESMGRVVAGMKVARPPTFDRTLSKVSGFVTPLDFEVQKSSFLQMKLLKKQQQIWKSDNTIRHSLYQEMKVHRVCNSMKKA